MEIIIVVILSVILSAIFNSEMDTIAEFQRAYYKNFEIFLRMGKEFTQQWLIDETYKEVKRKPWSRSPFWVLRVQWENKLQKTVLSAFGDGWHLTKALRVYFALIPATIIVLMFFGVNWYWALAYNIIAFGFQGFFFEISYEN